MVAIDVHHQPPSGQRVDSTRISDCNWTSSSLLMVFSQIRPVQIGAESIGFACRHYLTAMNDRHLLAQVRHVIDDVRREDDDDLFSDFAQEIMESHAFLRV